MIIEIAYLISAVLFIAGLKLLSSPKTARSGNLIGALGMMIAIIVTLLNKHIIDFTLIIIGLIIGSAIGIVLAKRVKMTAMPQMVALLNGFGGFASMLVSYAEYLRLQSEPVADVMATMVLSILVGSVTFTGSIIAFAKLQGLMRSSPIVYRRQQFVNGFLLLTTLTLGGIMLYDYTFAAPLIMIGVLSLILGILFVIPIGGADMPVVISLLNSYSGIAAAMTGFVISNSVLIIAGALVGASGIILTKIMCNAMNRSLLNVLFKGVGVESGATAAGASSEQRQAVRYTPEDASIIFDTAQSVIIVPGYGLAVSQAQHVLQEMAMILTQNGINVRYAIHPVAGRMPGHMNVLLAEANVPYDMLYEMDKINDDFQNTDVAIVIGANDVVNPSARYKKNSPLYGMPILNVDHAKTIMIIKRSLATGFAGEDNELFYNQKTMMIFGDAKKVLTELVRILKG